MQERAAIAKKTRKTTESAPLQRGYAFVGGGTDRGADEEAEADEDVGVRVAPLGDDVLLLGRQVVAAPREVGEEADDLLLRRQRRRQELAQTQREVDAGDQQRHQRRIQEAADQKKISKSSFHVPSIQRRRPRKPLGPEMKWKEVETNRRT